jgi:hypothetical protein
MVRQGAGNVLPAAPSGPRRQRPKRKPEALKGRGRGTPRAHRTPATAQAAAASASAAAGPEKQAVRLLVAPRSPGSRGWTRVHSTEGQAPGGAEGAGAGAARRPSWRRPFYPQRRRRRRRLRRTPQRTLQSQQWLPGTKRRWWWRPRDPPDEGSIEGSRTRADAKASNACGRASSSGVGGSRAGVAWIASASGPAKPRVKGVDAAAKGRNMPVKCGSTAVAEAPPPSP